MSENTIPDLSHPTPLILAVVVLYGQQSSASASLSVFFQAAQADDEIGRNYSLIIYDNSPHPQHPPAGQAISFEYVHDADNGGLAPAYTYALTQAEAKGSPWLLLLDQDTAITAEYLRVLLIAAKEIAETPKVAAIVPRLWAGNRLYSPEAPFLWQIRKQFAAKHFSVAVDARGIQSGQLTAYNSGAAIRVSALLEIGGFPAEFWLDYLDHAIFQSLNQCGYQIYILDVTLQQNLSHMDLNDVPYWRHRNVLAAQSLFVTRFGTLLDRFFFRLWLLKTSRTFRGACSDKRIWRIRVKQGLLLKAMSTARQPGER